MSLRTRLLLAFAAVVFIPLALLALGFREEMTGRLSLEYKDRLDSVQEGMAIDLGRQSADIDARLAAITRHLATITAGAHGFVEHYRTQLLARITELAPELVAASDHRLETEALLYAERSDVTEEITRLGSHLEQFSGLKKLNDEAGKRMDFILQEMNREVTTILSKTSGLNERGAAIGQAAIDIKVEIEKLREQVQNIE